MIINKITTGFVVQSFDVETGQFVKQEFIAGGTCWETDFGEPTAIPVSTPTLNFNMVQPAPMMVQPISSKPFKVGDQVMVTPLGDGSYPAHEFQGLCIGKFSGYVRVRDQDDNVYDCEPRQVKLAD